MKKKAKQKNKKKGTLSLQKESLQDSFEKNRDYKTNKIPINIKTLRPVTFECSGIF